jgi:hypothetical protein
MKIGNRTRVSGFSALVGAILLIAGPASANTYTLDFTDSNGDTADLTLTTAGAYGVVTSISGTFDGAAVTEATTWGPDQKIYGTGPLVDWAGLGFQTSATPYDLYWTNPARSAPGELGVCYVSTCDTTTGFWAVTSFTLTDPPPPTTPLPSTWMMLFAGLAGLGFVAYRGTKQSSAVIAVV